MFRHLEAPIKIAGDKTGNPADSEPVRRDCSLEINVSIDFHILHSGTESRACKHALECRACICKTIISISHLLRSSNRLPQRHPQAAML